ncbi:MAG TPA: hypothetical protein VFX51_01800, partial [Solirubrobacteraceae bacterium]|nr:hypothetical protein [Solirubrobacteraceae bacterium]
LSSRGRWVPWVAGAVVAAVVVAIVLLLVPHNRSNAANNAAAEAQRAAARTAELRARWEREAQPLYGRGPAARDPQSEAALAPRRALVAGLEDAVTADAADRARRGELDGQYRSTGCFRFPKGVDDLPPADDLANSVAIVECIAVAAKVAPSETTTGSMIGQPYRARVDFRRGRYAFCKIVQQPGELAIQRRPVIDIPRACSGKA